ncbi:MAG: DUF2339 domain-containing protein [Ascidiaceihabitans sp.]|nr:DUF2339 domain-containing protein [Ascidiaceihabitans sp.]
MVGLGVLAGLWVIGLPVAVIYLLISNSTLKSKLAQLETAVKRLGKPDNDTVQDTQQTTAKPVPKQTAKAQTLPEPERAESVRPEPMRIIKTAEPSVAATPPQPREPNAAERLFAWLQMNWFYAVSALSLALAGLFLVQYGMENGLLPPTARVLCALAFGAALIGAGEYIRRRFGEARDSTTEYLPSVFAGAGIVSLFGSVLSAEMLYGLISPEAALVGMIAVALIALVLGWFYGPLLAAVGLIGAFGAPMVLGGSNSDPTPLFGYFAIVAAAGLGMDTLRRWAWGSVLALVLGFVMGFMLMVPDDSLQGAFALYVTVLAILAVTIPARSVWPDHGGAALVSFAMGHFKAEERPQFPTVLAAGTVAAASLGLVYVTADGQAEFWIAVICATALASALVCWSVRAQALQDQAIAPILALIAMVAWHALNRGDAYSKFLSYKFAAPESPFPWTVTTLVVLGAAVSCLAAWRAQKPGIFGVGWAAAAALTAPALAIIVEVTWTPSTVIGAYPWALQGAALAAMMVFWAERFARKDSPEKRLRMSLFVLSALSCISFALVMIFSAAALTAALAVTVVVAAALDRKFNLPAMSYFIAAGVVTTGYRLVADPGLDWAFDTALWELLLSHGGAVATFVAALFIQPRNNRITARIMLDSAAWSAGGILVSILLFRYLDAALGEQGTLSHWAMGIYAAIWLGLALAQVQRLDIQGHHLMWMVRVVLGAVFGLIGLGALALGVIVFSPLFSSYFGKVAGAPVFNTLAVSLLLPAAVLAIGVWRLQTLPRLLSLAMKGLAGALTILWIFSVIRHFWQGAGAMPLDRGMSQPELYSYTIALLIAGAGLFYQSLARKSSVMRKAGLAVIGLAVAKVFLIDISGLEGLTRVFSLLVLGLSLAGLAWLIRWAQVQDTDKNDA